MNIGVKVKNETVDVTTECENKLRKNIHLRCHGTKEFLSRKREVNLE
jgi:hypothetical protein